MDLRGQLRQVRQDESAAFHKMFKSQSSIGTLDPDLLASCCSHTHTIVIVLLIAFAAAALATLAIVRSAKMHHRFTADDDFAKPQGFHAHAAPRIGGLGIVFGLVAGATTLTLMSSSESIQLWVLLACSLPAFLAGFVQDFTEAISPKGRLIATMLSALLAMVALELSIRETGIPLVDWLISFGFGSALLTVVVVAGIANAINIVDGFNGLAAMCVVIMLSALAYVAYQVSDLMVASMALTSIGAVLGFFVWNFPLGLIFMGDGGAYLLGFLVCEISIFLLNRNRGEVSPFFPLLVCIYPVFETLFSVYRRRIIRALPASVPDGIHLHSLIHRRLLRWAVGNRSSRALTRRNSMTSPYLWMLTTLSVIPAVLFWNQSDILAGFLVLFGVTYSVLYWRIVRFKSPSWMRFAGSSKIQKNSRQPE